MPLPHASRGLLAVAAVSALSFAQPAFAQSGSYGTDRGSCDRSAIQEVFSTSKGNIIGSLAGAAAGGLLGNQFGGGTGKGLMTAVGVVGGALAGGYVGRQMAPADHACTDRTLEHARTGESVAWRNPENGAQYRVTPTSTYQGSNGLPCRNFTTQAVIDGQNQQVEGTACRRPDGVWSTMDGNSGGTVTGDTIFQVQQRLRDLGFYVRDNIDGRWGPKTSTAVANFQRSKALQATGQLDQPTLAALGVGQAGAPPAVQQGAAPPPPPPGTPIADGSWRDPQPRQ